MLKVLRGKQMKLVDKECIEKTNITSLALMDNAGRAVYEEINDCIEQNNIENPSVLVVCGKGNNAGDGFVAAKHLINNLVSTKIICLFDKNEIQGDAKFNFDSLSDSSKILYFNKMEEEDFINHIQNADIIVDAILGTGINSELKGEIKKAVELVNQFAEGIVISVDIPTGLSADTAQVLGATIVADTTICLQSPKIGNILPPAMEFNGTLVVSDIGIPDELIYKNPKHNINLLTDEDILELLPSRLSDGNKGDFGKVLSIVGSRNLSGSGYLAGKSILKVGAGYSILCCP
jgi:NAD(P)H-hydrate epimerase